MNATTLFKNMLSAKEARLRVREFESSLTAQTLRNIELAITRAADRGLSEIRYPTYVEPDYNQIISILRELGYAASLDPQLAFIKVAWWANNLVKALTPAYQNLLTLAYAKKLKKVTIAEENCPW